MILVVGATGHLGTAVCKRLVREGYPVRALVRPGSRYRHLATMGVELMLGDLQDIDSVRAACRGVTYIVATANANLPTDSGSTFDSVEGVGYLNLFRVAMRTPIDRLVFASLPRTPYDDLVPTYRYKRLNEARLRKGGLPFTIVRSAPFMDDWLALIGSRLPLRGEGVHSLGRRCWFPRAYMSVGGRLIDSVGVALIPGFGWTRHAFISVDDVAWFMVEAMFRSDSEGATYRVGGPQVLTWNEAADAYARVTGRRVRKIHIPPAALRVQQIALQRIAPPVANLLGASWVHAQWETPFLPGDARPVLDPRSMTTVESFLRKKSVLAA